MAKEDRDRIVNGMAEAMRGRLDRPKNKAKGDNWESCDLDWLMMRLSQEVAELFDAAVNFGDKDCDKDLVLAEAADVANLAAMIADWHLCFKRPEVAGGADGPRRRSKPVREL